MSDESTHLSPAGVARRGEILAIAQQRARTKRLARRATGSAAAVAIVATLAWLSIPRAQPSPKVITHETAPQQVVPPPPAAVAVAVPIPVPVPAPVREPRVTKVEFINDDELLAALARAGHPSGIIEINGRAMLVRR